MSDANHAPAATSATDQPRTITIERLVLDVPGLTRTGAEAIGQAIGERLARAGIKDAPPRIGITLGPIGGDDDQLAQRVAAALLERLV
jgi:hypothetical protein